MDKLDIRRVTIFLFFAFGFSWIIALLIYLAGGYQNSPAIIPNTPFNVAFALTILYMLGPTVGNIAARVLTQEGRHDLWLAPKLRRGWKYWLLAWFLTPVLTLGGAVLYFVMFSNQFSSSLLTARSLSGIPDIGLPNWFVILGIVLGSILVAPLVNGLASLGEEFGWRAYLQPKLLPLGEKKTYLLVGIIWGVWHWPVIWLGRNYPGHPVLGPLAMIWFTFLVGTFFGWAALRGGSVWPAVIGHSVLNGLANLPVLFLAGTANPLVGPLAVGIIGGSMFIFSTILIFWKADEIPRD